MHKIISKLAAICGKWMCLLGVETTWNWRWCSCHQAAIGGKSIKEESASVKVERNENQEISEPTRNSDNKSSPSMSLQQYPAASSGSNIQSLTHPISHLLQPHITISAGNTAIAQPHAIFSADGASDHSKLSSSINQKHNPCNKKDSSVPNSAGECSTATAAISSGLNIRSSSSNVPIDKIHGSPLSSGPIHLSGNKGNSCYTPKIHPPVLPSCVLTGQRVLARYQESPAFSCHICGTPFTRKGNWKRHMINSHFIDA